MKKIVKLISHVAMSAALFTICSCGGGGGGGGGGGDAATNGDNTGTNAGNNSTAAVDYAPAAKANFSSLSFGPYKITNPNTVKASHLSGVFLGYTYKKTGKNRAEISIWGEKTQDFQAAATLIDGIFRIQNYPGVTVFEVEANLTLEFLSKTEVKVVGYEERTRYSYTTRILNLISLGESTDSSTYNTKGTWR